METEEDKTLDLNKSNLGINKVLLVEDELDEFQNMYINPYNLLE
jgi:hypothetical protein